MYDNDTMKVTQCSMEKQNRKLRTQILSKQTEIDNLRSELSDLKDNLELTKKSNKYLVDTQTKLEEENCKIQRHLSEIGGSLNCPENVGTPQVKQSKFIGKKVNAALWFAKQYGLTPQLLNCKNSSNETVKIELSDKNFSNLTPDDKEKVRGILYVLDKFGISDESYHEISFLTEDLPSISIIKNERQAFNSRIDIFRCPGNTPGAYVTIESEIRKHVHENNLPEGSRLQIKISGDGAKVSRVSNFVTLSLSFLGENGASPLKTLAIAKCSENYDNIKVLFDPLFRELNNLNSLGKIDIDGKSYLVCSKFGGDMKFIQLCLGMNGSTATHACPWCHVHKSDRTDLSKSMSYYDSKDLKRTNESLRLNSAVGKLGSKQPPLINIEPENIILDELHLQLRICDVLLQNLIDDCKQLDSKLEVLGEKPHHLQDFVCKVRECGVSFNTWVDKGNSELNWTSLTGSDYNKLLKQLPEKLLFVVSKDTHDQVVFLWNEFTKIHKCVSNSSVQSTELFHKVKTWMQTFQGLSAKGRLGYDRVTIYMHALLYHVPLMVERHGCLSNYSGQGVEKLNDVIKNIHQKSSNKLNQAHDELMTRKRIEQLTQYERKKRTYSKTKSDFWERDIFGSIKAKRQKIENDISAAHCEYLNRTKQSESQYQN